jgi:hypothetical protein
MKMLRTWAALSLLASAACLGARCDEEKITICHYPPGNSANGQTITIDMSAWPTHEAHGDYQGACNVEAPEETDCTADDGYCNDDTDCCSGDCEYNECVRECKENGARCTTEDDCCSGSCENGYCDTPCVRRGTCDSNDDCCGGEYCNDGECMPPPECIADGRQCESNEECCNGSCYNGNCEICPN